MANLNRGTQQGFETRDHNWVHTCAYLGVHKYSPQREYIKGNGGRNTSTETTPPANVEHRA